MHLHKSMTLNRILSLSVFWILPWLSIASSAVDSSAFCHNEVFKAECAEGEAIIITHALYGRMSLGRCVKTDFGFVGCVVDVIAHAHTLCSGRRECQIRVPDAGLDKFQLCNPDLKSYLEITYECVKVQPAVTECEELTSSKLTEQSGYISNDVALATKCGSTTSPWIIEAMPGQRINLTLLDFTHTVGQADGDGSEGNQKTDSQFVCQEYATLNETAFKKMTNICGGGAVATRHVYTSLGNTLVVALSDALEDQHFLLKYEAVGCPELQTPQRTWVKPDYDRAEMGCISSDVTWTLVCEGTEWTGTMENCTLETSEMQKRGGGFSLSMGMSVFIVLGVSAVVGLIVLIIGLIYLRRRRRRHHHGASIPMKDIRPLREDIHYEPSMYARNTAFEPVKVHVPKKCPDSASDVDENEYEYVWDISPGLLQSPDVTCTSQCARGTDKCTHNARHCIQSMTLPVHRHCPEHGKASRLQRAFAQTLTLPYGKHKKHLVDNQRAGTLARCHCAEARPRPKSHHVTCEDKPAREQRLPQSCSHSVQDSGNKRYISKPVATAKPHVCSNCRGTHHDHRHCCHTST